MKRSGIAADPRRRRLIRAPVPDHKGQLAGRAGDPSGGYRKSLQRRKTRTATPERPQRGKYGHRSHSCILPELREAQEGAQNDAQRLEALEDIENPPQRQNAQERAKTAHSASHGNRHRARRRAARAPEGDHRTESGARPEDLRKDPAQDLPGDTARAPRHSCSGPGDRFSTAHRALDQAGRSTSGASSAGLQARRIPEQRAAGGQLRSFPTSAHTFRRNSSGTAHNHRRTWPSSEGTPGNCLRTPESYPGKTWSHHRTLQRDPGAARRAARRQKAAVTISRYRESLRGTAAQIIAALIARSAELRQNDAELLRKS